MDNTTVEHDDPFLTWLQHAVARGMARNTAGARVHRVAEGVLLVSPNIFRDYAAEVFGNESRWLSVQKQFCKLELHERAPDNTHIREYRVARPGGRYRAHTVNGLLIPDPNIVFTAGQAPPPNPYLTMIRIIQENSLEPHASVTTRRRAGQRVGPGRPGRAASAISRAVAVAALASHRLGGFIRRLVRLALRARDGGKTL